jgi:subfamily B ATP-binding cassette protein MsbA
MQNHTTPSENIRRLLPYMRKMWPVFLISCVAMMVYGLVDAAFIWLIQPFIDQGFVDTSQASSQVLNLSEPSSDVLELAPWIVMGLFLIRGIANFISSYGLSYMSQTMIMQLRQKMLEHYLHLPVAYVDDQSSGHLISKVTYDIEQVSRASGFVITHAVRQSFSMFAYVAVMLWHSWQLSLCVFVTLPILFMIVIVVSKRFRKLALKIQASMGNVSTMTDQMIKGHKNVLMFGAQKIESDRFYQANRHNRSRNMKLALAQAISQPMIMFIGSISIAVVLYVASIDAIRSELTAGSFASFFFAMVSVFRPIKALTSLNQEMQRGLAAASSIFEMLDEATEEDQGSYINHAVKGRLEFKAVSFTYAQSVNPVLNNLSCKVEPGETLALVGRSGSGKSTLTHLLTRFYQPQQGEILLDGVPIDDYDLNHFRSHLGWVSQDIVLFNDTVANNIAYACGDEVDFAAIEAAAEKAYALDFIRQLPKGFDTKVGENGTKLSGGQKQRIAIARAILRNAPILILDEATSALDTESERMIQKALDNLSQNRTCLTIAHRLSTIENADKIAVMNEGRLVEFGTHAQLLAQQGIYAGLHHFQFDQEPKAFA